MPKLSIETEFDKNNKIIGDAMSDCMLMLKYNLCKSESCDTCDTKKLIDSLYNKSAGIDRLAIDKIASINFAIKDKMYKERYKKVIGVTINTVKTIIAAISLIALFTFIIIGYYYFNTYKYLPKQNVPYIDIGPSLHDERLYDLLNVIYNDTHKYVTDVNNDNEINCIDYSITFKILYDTHFNTDYQKSNCEIVRNMYNGFNHLFIRVRYNAYSAWECIEPQSLYPVDIETAWGEDYNPVYNIYGETKRWVNIMSIK